MDTNGKNHKYIGYNNRRLETNPDEAKLIELINEEANHNPNLFEYIRHGNGFHNCSEDEIRLMITGMQWLLSPVGQGILDKLNFVKDYKHLYNGFRAGNKK